MVNASDAEQKTDLPEPVPDEGSLLNVGQIRLLIVDDDTEVCRFILAALVDQGYTMDAVSQPAKIENALRNGVYHVIILDYVIPGLNSEQLLGWVQELQPQAGIIVVTGYPSIDSALSCLRARTFDYLTKPFPVNALRDAVSRCLESKGLLRVSVEALRVALGSAIRERRKALGLTLGQMAERSSLSVSYLSQVELGKCTASIETLYRISLALGIKLSELFQSVRMLG